LIVDGEAPVDGPLVGIVIVLLGRHFYSEGGAIRHPPVKAVAAEHTQVDLGDVEPVAMFGLVIDLHPLGQSLGFGSGGKTS
jgi:hypothetical protein